MSGRVSLGQFDCGGVKMRGNITSFQPGGVDRPHEANADGTGDYHEVNVLTTLVFELSYVPAVRLEQIQALKDQVGTLTYSNNVRYRIPNCSFSTKDTIGAEGKVSITFMGGPAERLS